MLALLTVGATAAALSGCGGGGGGGTTLTAVVRGRIMLVTTGAAPSPAATVTAGGATAATAADGSFVLAAVPVTTTRIAVTATGMKALNQTLPTLSAGKTTDLADIYLSDVGYTADIATRVVRSDTAAAVAGATVLVSGLTAVSGADGSVSIAGLPVGLGGPLVQVGVAKATGYEDKAIIFDLPLGAGANSVGDIVLSPPVGEIPPGPSTIRGKVTWTGGTAFGGTSVSLLSRPGGVVVANGITQDAGDYGFWAPAGSYTVVATRSGYAEARKDCDLARPDVPIQVDLTLTPAP
ncbi:MAG: carboxypeptidase-like regulatory domain-containing protein [Armatimonadetes bacterium]|nr:carboxypeptidase-like regulatory domain-containing protein [Armatimonadota bacterium]